MRIGRAHAWYLAIAIVAAIIASFPAWAHPHVFVEGHAEIVFDVQRRMAAVRNIWLFDKAYSAFASTGLDKNGDRKLSRQELVPLAKLNVDSLKDYAYFTYLSIGKTHLAFKPPTDYFVTEDKGQLTLYFTLPLAHPAPVADKTVLEIFDPEYFVAFTFPKHDAVRLADAPAACSAAFHPPHVLDAAIMAKLAAVPIEQHDLPPALQDAAVGLANLFTVECSG